MIKYYFDMLKTHYKIDISYTANEYAEKSQETIVKNINSILEKYPVKHINWSLILSDPLRNKKELQALVVRFQDDLQKVKVIWTIKGYVGMIFFGLN